MQPPKNPRDESDQGGGRLIKRPRAENKASNNPRRESAWESFFGSTTNRGSAGNQSISGTSSTPSHASPLGTVPAQPKPLRLPSPVAPSGNLLQGGKSNEPKPSASQTMGNRYRSRPSRPSAGDGSVAFGHGQKDTQHSGRLPPVKAEGATTKKEGSLAATAADAQPVISPESVPHNVEVLHARGDLTLVAGRRGIRFRVSSQALALVSPAWQNKIDGPSSEKTARRGAEGWVMRLPEDDAGALRVVLQVIHYKFDALPKAVTREQLFHLTVLCDKYEMIGVLEPFWHKWIGNHPGSDHEPKAFVQGIWIAHTLGHLRSYESILEEFMYSTHKYEGYNEPRLCLESHRDFDLYEDPYLQDLDILRHCELGRLRMMDRVAFRIERALEDLSDPKYTRCQCRYASNEWQMTCDCAMLGGLHRALHGKSWYSSKGENWVDQVTFSVRQLVNKVDGVRSAAIGESKMRKKQGETHKTCSPWKPFELEDILKECPVRSIVPLDYSGFQQRAEKSGLQAFAECQ